MKIQKILTSTLLAVACMFSATAAMAEKPDAPATIEGATTVDAEAVLELISDKEGLVVIDSRKTKDFVAGHIEGSVHLVSTDTNADSLAKVLDSKATPVLFYCNGVKCGRAAKAAEIAVEAGYTEVYYYFLGIKEWKEEDFPLVTGE